MIEAHAASRLPTVGPEPSAPDGWAGGGNAPAGCEVPGCEVPASAVSCVAVSVFLPPGLAAADFFFADFLVADFLAPLLAARDFLVTDFFGAGLLEPAFDGLAFAEPFVAAVDFGDFFLPAFFALLAWVLDPEAVAEPPSGSEDGEGESVDAAVMGMVYPTKRLAANALTGFTAEMRPRTRLFDGLRQAH